MQRCLPILPHPHPQILRQTTTRYEVNSTAQRSTNDLAIVSNYSLWPDDWADRLLSHFLMTRFCALSDILRVLAFSSLIDVRVNG